jgi:Major Facilitator Superfamily
VHTTPSTCTSDLHRSSNASRWGVLAILSIAIVLSLTTWFSATAITPELKREWHLSPFAISWLTIGVQIGFVCGALAASLVNLPDIVRLNWLMALSALLAAAANATLLTAHGPVEAVAARIVTGFALAGVYPPALKVVSTWFNRDRGIALGAVVGALTIGSSMPHLFRSLSAAVDWRFVVKISTLATSVGGVLLWLFAREGPLSLWTRYIRSTAGWGCFPRSRPPLGQSRLFRTYVGAVCNVGMASGVRERGP